MTMEEWLRFPDGMYDGQSIAVKTKPLPCVQYYQLKYGFHAVLTDKQLAKLRPIFRVNNILS